MVWIPGGTFQMGSDSPLSRRDERPVHAVRVDGFWIDTTEVTNEQFAAFVEATGHVTTAEKPVDWEELKAQLPPGTPKPSDEMLRPGSLVFVMPGPGEQWWRWVHGADWRHPEGPGSSIADRMDHPVVHVSHDDALAYCEWAGKRLPTEAEWERAARAGVEGKDYIWGDELEPGGEHRANIWQGRFPVENTEADGFATTNPVRAYPPNEWGLYGMAGNVWEWCSDWYRPDTYAERVKAAGREPIDSPTGPASSFDPDEPTAPKRVIRGGSYLCHASYCASYRPAARMRSTADTGLMHTGFRCVSDAPAPESDAPDDDARPSE